MNVGLSSPRFEKYALLYPTSTSLQKELCNYYSVVINLCTGIVLFVRKPVFKQIASALRKPFDDEFGTFQKDLVRIGTAVKEELSLASKQQQNLDSIEAAHERKENSLFRATSTIFRREASNELVQARKWREARAKSRFLDSLSTYNFEATLNQARKKGASTWIFGLEEYQQWVSSKSSSMLLCSGIVGAGKTVLCANVIEDLILKKSLDSSLAYFFCRSDEAASLKAREVIGSLARQFFEDLPIESLELNQAELSIGDIIPDIERILSKMLLLLPRHKQCFLVLDGLDECDYEEVWVLIESIQSLLKSSEYTFRVFWTGRSDFASRVSDQFRPDFQVHISPTNNRPEISRFINLALENALESNRLKLRDPNVVLKIQDALEAGAQEMFVLPPFHYTVLASSSPVFRFLWVAFQIDSICAQNTDHDILFCLETLPKGLPATFRQILRRLKHSVFADPSLGRTIFEIVAAAQRPLTLDELGEAISITPGDTGWNKSKLVNDTLKSLESCGSFIVVDEELSTVHFAHSSVKRHLLSEPTDLDIRDYHIDLAQADTNLGSITITYLNLDLFSNQLIKTGGLSQPYAANVPSFVVKSALPKHEVVNRMALAILRGRKRPGIDPGPDMEKTANLVLEKNTDSQGAFFFLPYCQEYWLYHSKTIHESEHIQVYKLWNRLVNGTMSTTEVPWAPEKHFELGEQFIGWVTNNCHIALMRIAIQQLWSTSTILDVDNYRDTSNIRACTEKLEKVLRLLSSEDARPLRLLPSESACTRVHFEPSYGMHLVLQKAAAMGYEAVVRLFLQEGVNTKSWTNLYDDALYSAVEAGQKTIAELLIKGGADVNLQDGSHGSVLQAAAATHGMDPIVELLLEKGANVNVRGRKYGTALIAAAAIDNVAAIRLLLNANVDVNDADPMHGTALISAVANDNLSAVFTLLEGGANVNLRAPYGKSPLQVAAERGNEHVIKQLLGKGASIDKSLENEYKYMKFYHTTSTKARLLYAEAKSRDLKLERDHPL